MPGQLNSVKSRKRKRSSQVKSSRKSKASATRRRCMRSPKRHPASESSSVVSGAYGKADGLSLITCECQQSAGRRRCSASPELEGQEGKENELRTGMDVDRVNGISDMDCDETSKTMFPDDDSNQILPVEQFFGNLEAVQDFPQRSRATSTRGQRGNRRRHYYAREDSDEEEVGFGSVQGDDRGDISDM